MIREQVRSSNIRSIGYDNESRTLEVEFHSGGIYQYFNVPEAVYSGLMSASSHGSYFYRNVRKRFRYAKIR